MKTWLFFFMMLLSLISKATSIPVEALQACASGETLNAIQISVLPFQEITKEDGYAKNYKATYSTAKGKKIGYAKKGLSRFILYDRYLYSVSKATLVHMSKEEYKNMLRRGQLELDQVSDWSLLKLKNEEEYLCIALNKSMEKAIPLIYLLSISTNPKKLYFQSGL